MPLHESSLARSMCSDVLAEVQDVLTAELRRLPPPDPRTNRALLDVGCWDGLATTSYAAVVGAKAHGLEVFPGPAHRARLNGVAVAYCDLETDAFPWPRDTFDVVIANQVLEHLKNIWLPLSEVCRVLRPGGHFLVSVPNLASLHNRLLLLLGMQPTSIRVLGPHVRGFTPREFVRLLTLNGAFDLVRLRGAGFYPLPRRWARPFAGMWRAASHTLIVVLRKRSGVRQSPWLSVLAEDTGVGGQTYYNQGRERDPTHMGTHDPI